MTRLDRIRTAKHPWVSRSGITYIEVKESDVAWLLETVDILAVALKRYGVLSGQHERLKRALAHLEEPE